MPQSAPPKRQTRAGQEKKQRIEPSEREVHGKEASQSVILAYSQIKSSISGKWYTLVGERQADKDKLPKKRLVAYKQGIISSVSFRISKLKYK